MNNAQIGYPFMMEKGDVSRLLNPSSAPVRQENFKFVRKKIFNF